MRRVSRKPPQAATGPVAFEAISDPLGFITKVADGLGYEKEPAYRDHTFLSLLEAFNIVQLDIYNAERDLLRLYEMQKTQEWMLASEIDKKAESVRALQSHIASVLENLPLLLDRLQQDYPEDEYLPLEPQYHSRLATLFQSFRAGIASFPKDMDNIQFFHMIMGKLDAFRELKEALGKVPEQVELTHRDIKAIEQSRASLLQECEQ